MKNNKQIYIPPTDEIVYQLFALNSTLIDKRRRRKYYRNFHVLFPIIKLSLHMLLI